MRGASCDESTGTGPIIFIALNTDKQPPPPPPPPNLNENTHIMMTPTVIIYDDTRSLISNKEILIISMIILQKIFYVHFLVVFYSCGI